MNCRTSLLRITILLLAGFACAENSPAEDLNIVPRPVSVKRLTGSFSLNGETRILALDREPRRIASLFQDFLLTYHGLDLKFAQVKPSGGNYIEFTQIESQDVPPEGYRLVVGTKAVQIVGHPAGLFYGMQTFTQLLPEEIKPSVVLPALEIIDHPRFPYRGTLLDVGRHFFSVTFIKKYLDLLAQYKINYFHWHLTDDQGWRIEIKKYPKLTEIGSLRNETVKEQHFDPFIGDGIPHGGFYTQDQIRDIVAYAQARFITIVPEIEMPGHSQAALAAYPELACTPGPFSVSTAWGVHTEVFCPKEETFRFL